MDFVDPGQEMSEENSRINYTTETSGTERNDLHFHALSITLFMAKMGLIPIYYYYYYYYYY